MSSKVSRYSILLVGCATTPVRCKRINLPLFFHMNLVCSLSVVLLVKEIINPIFYYADAKNISLKTILLEYPKNSELNRILIEVITKRAGHFNCLTIIRNASFQDMLQNIFFKELGTVPLYQILVDETEDLISPNYNTLKVLQQIKQDDCQGFVILSNPNQVSRLLRFGDRYREINTRALFILLHDFLLFRSDLHFLWKKIVNVVFIKQHSGTRQRSSWFELSTVPFPAPISSVLVPRRLEVWRHGILSSGLDLFAKKTDDLRGHTLKVVTFPHFPATQRSEREGGGARYGGVEIEILRTMSKVMNFLPLIYEPRNADKEQWGQEQLNGSFNGLIGEIINGDADIGLGNLHHTPFHLHLMDLSVPYDTQCLTFLTPESLRDISWKTLILPFKPEMWAAILVTLLLGGFIFYALAKFHSHFGSHQEMKPEGLYLFGEVGNSVLYTLAMLLLVSLPKLPTGWSLRMLTGWWWLYCLLVVVAYRASMTAVLANPVPRVTIDTMEQLASDKSIGCGCWGNQIKEFFLSSLDSAGQAIGAKMEVLYDTEASLRRVQKGKFTYYENVHFLRHSIVELELKKSNRSQEHEGGPGASWPLHVMRECAVSMPVSLGLRRNSPLRPRVDHVVRRVVEAGLVAKWLADATRADDAARRKAKPEADKALMDLSKLYGAVVALGAGYLLGLLALIAEVVHWKYVARRHPLFDIYNLQAYYSKK